MINVLVTLDFDDAWLASVASVSADVQVRRYSAKDAGEIPAGMLAETDVLYTNTAFPAAGAAPRLRWVQLDTSGCDHLKGTDLWASDVPVTTIGGVSPKPLAEWVLMMILAHAHHLPHLIDLHGRRHWPDLDYRWNRLMPRMLPGSTVGIVGYGRIGQEIGRLAHAFGMNVIGMRRGGVRTGERFSEADDATPATVVGPDGLHDLLARSDYVVLTVPHTDETHHLLDAAAFGHVKPGAVVINGARGGVVDEDALLAALRNGQVGHLISDVFAQEPLPESSPFWSESNVLITPHVAGFAPGYHDHVRVLFTENLRRLVEGRPLLNLVDRKAGY
ncbi:3-phosphoglycerate dehydrogenase [Acrocarpospora phusangensis]|uniref:3-phosphoglycerate dehydrogenase n=1 Tax=Acrocarpospora phusangensis TaxID=1070424 RepID=A0A919URV7_9ACTN|nr:D-2-hydroxyacid dehydrogenase [Acrocarpospora phusangensis]GIH28472.1 3-phosphoglycerate dehydrogenase [Acrocarpospora phusangensis]